MTEMKRSLNILTVGTILLLTCFLLIPDAKAASYDYYVDKSYDGSQDGSKEKPFTNISDAINADDSDAKIFIKKGTYGENIVIGKGIDLYGENRSKVLLSGKIEMEDNSSINDLTITDVATAVLVGHDASAQINSCTIKKFGKIGVEVLSGNGKIAIKNSSIYGGQGKGIYIELGRKIEISGNDIYGNKEEGIDVRAKVNGVIKNNNIHDNGESGIEIIIGSSDVLISGNDIKKNGASGIASQFYQETKKIGAISINANTIAKNKKYGLDCALPSGGKPDSSYWGDSINLIENDMEANGMRSVSSFCHIIDAVDKIEEKATNKTDEKEDETITAIEEDSITADEDAEKDEKIWENAESVSKYATTLEAKVQEQIDKINATSKLRLLFLGINPESIDFIKNEIAINKDQTAMLKDDLKQVDNIETQNALQSLIGGMENRSRIWEDFVQEKESKKTIFAWLQGLLMLS